MIAFYKILEKNKQFKNIHKGESCYIFGNGSSLKYYDLNLFNDRVSIGCGSLFCHNDIKKIDLKYHYAATPFFHYNFWKNPYSGKYEKNKVGSFYKDRMKSNSNSDVQYFTCLSNYFAIQGENINYVYHFGQADSSSIGCQMDSVFTPMKGALSAMIGVALYMGFENITLVGCDYTSSPQKIGHFYEFGEGYNLETDNIINEANFNSLSEIVNINSITIDNKYKGKVIPSVSYFDFTNSVPIYKENNEIVSAEDLLELDSLNVKYIIFEDES